MVDYLWLIPCFPLLGFLINSSFGARMSKTVVSWVACLAIFFSFLVSIGVFEVLLQQPLPGQPPMVKVTLDDSLASRRRIVQDIIHEMMDPAVAAEKRDSAVAWSRALQNTLMELFAESERAPLYKSGP